MSVHLGVLEVSEVSGAVPLPDGSLLVLSDEEGAFLVPDAAPLLAAGRVERKKAAPLEGFDKIDDMEDASYDPKSGHVFVVTSHSRNKRGQVKKKRYRIVRLSFGGHKDNHKDGKAKKGSQVRVEHDDWLLWAIWKRMPELMAATLRTPAQGGLNIEGAVVAYEGDLLIGLRSPTATLREVNEEKPEAAQILRVSNPNAIWDEPEGKDGAPELRRRPIHLDLDGQGVRGLCRDEAGGYLILSNMAVDPNHQARSEWHVWKWSGDEADAPRRCLMPDEVCKRVENPEAIAVLPIKGKPHLMLVGDEEGESPYALIPLSDLKTAKS